MSLAQRKYLAIKCHEHNNTCDFSVIVADINKSGIGPYTDLPIPILAQIAGHLTNIGTRIDMSLAVEQRYPGVGILCIEALDLSKLDEANLCKLIVSPVIRAHSFFSALLARMMSERNTYRDSLTKHAAKLSELQNQVKQASAKETSTKKALAAAQSQLEDANDNLEDARIQHDFYEREIKRLRESLDELQHESVAYHSTREQNSKLQRGMTDSSSQVKTLEDKNKALEMQVVNLRSECQRLSQERDGYNLKSGKIQRALDITKKQWQECNEETFLSISTRIDQHIDNFNGCNERLIPKTAIQNTAQKGREMQKRLRYFKDNMLNDDNYKEQSLALIELQVGSSDFQSLVTVVQEYQNTAKRQ